MSHLRHGAMGGAESSEQVRVQFSELVTELSRYGGHCSILLTGRYLNLAVIVFGPSQFASTISRDYYFNWQDMTPPGSPLIAKPRANL